MSDYIELPVNQIELDRSNPRIASFLDLYGEEKLDSDTMALLLGTASDSCASLRSDTLLEVKPGDNISVVYRNSSGCYGKINGLVGWYYGGIFT